MQTEIGLLIVLGGSALCAAIGGSIASLKNRSPLEGCLLGAILGPLGILLICRKPFAHRPVVDPWAWESFRSVVEHQSSHAILPLAATQSPLQSSSPATAAAHQRSA